MSDTATDAPTPCPTCRSYIIDIHRLNGDVTRQKAFAHAHHHLTKGAARAVIARRVLRRRYADHKAGHITPDGDANAQGLYATLTRRLAAHLTDHSNGDAA